jgi:hypothetical protein
MWQMHAGSVPQMQVPELQPAPLMSKQVTSAGLVMSRLCCMSALLPKHNGVTLHVICG